MNLLKYLSLKRRSLRYKLLIAFSLMSIIPLLIIAYFVTNYVFSDSENIFQTTAVILFTMWIAWSGYILIRKIINPVIDLALETKIIAGGQYDSKILLRRDDELGDIANAVNTMTGKIRGYIGELQEYSKKTASLNVRIHKKVLTLTNLIRMGDLITTGVSFDEIANFATEKMARELYGGFSAIFMKDKMGKYFLKSIFDLTDKNMVTAGIESELPFVEKLFARNEYLLLDSAPPKNQWQRDLMAKLNQMNAIIFPLTAAENVIGIIILGNFAEEFRFDDEDVEVVRAFEKELVLGYQSSLVYEKVKSLEVVDSLTGIYTYPYLEERLEDEINRAVYYQRPCSLIIIKLDDFDKYSDHYGMAKSKRMVKQVAKLLNTSIPPVGKAAHFDNDEFGVLLPELNKRESLDIAEDIRKKIEQMRVASDEKERITASIGVGENPIDGANAKDVIAKARQYAEKARGQGKNKVVGWV
ncbi:MAG: diguanylate cyclase [Candidatus Omnitrophota bacterium]|nr:diguanylate cyclase [Candidatus Omnitrophota bacterium]